MYHHVWGFRLALATFLQLLRPYTLAEQHALRVYRDQVEAVRTRVQTVFDDWIALREIEPDYARLANAAAVNRWQLLRLVNHAERLRPPRLTDKVHKDVLTTVTSAARACQLLANGYRFHKSEAVCDGQAMLLESVNELSELVQAVNLR